MKNDDCSPSKQLDCNLSFSFFFSFAECECLVAACGIWFPDQTSNWPPALGAQEATWSHWTTREVP